MRQADPPTIVWYRSQVLWGVLISAAMKLAFVLFRWQAPFSDADVQAVSEVVTLVASFVGDAIAAKGRISATAQPVTLTEAK